ncbi:hypothetical protein COCC4DRAFT_18779 [Bipolaris maydis ATCC 48331]|uniref:Uncharacterized protein n=2 Tax=Cochliobolus heterostrophus TaxID=5016 RepID=M2V833_COCH5|nr:uncharacterized protein COCC4DRAFT_18779 [Bipolaris maydis ATCC 48331]EMD95888.1 hypothetical protein COCHEDRAFT_1151982 [Bipolaris maydis C5]KAH7561780.1 hypothetical protein BM1_02884 [Bipolaris maydis]ENI10748.1 hypothetical protein COCC4DRAFT_18779 [Bipolaris maydis ATCC 48331]KAJ5030599.1 hypothetical protein J3E73DRAFT_405057 [Bipolaris maydis]KAJ6200818.1 hypothetical protein J3E72DRAFT_372008 [Bipolaris maydis]
MNRYTTQSPASTDVSLADSRDSATRRHDNPITSAETVEIDFLKRQLQSLTRAKAQASKKCDDLFRDISAWSEKYEKEKTRRTQSEEKLAKERRTVIGLKKEMKEMKEKTDKEVREVKSELENERKKWMGQVPSTNRKPKGAVQVSAANLQSRIKHLEEENARLQSLTNHYDCERIYEDAQQRIDDAMTLLRTTEAEVEELHHLESANEELTEQHYFDTQQIEELFDELECCKGKVEKLENEIAIANEQRSLESPTSSHSDISDISPGASLTPIQPLEETSETDHLRQTLHDAEAENEKIISAFAKLSHEHCDTMVELDELSEQILLLHNANLDLEARNEVLESQLQAAVQLLHATNEETEQDCPAHHRSHTTFSDPAFVNDLPTSNPESPIPVNIRLYEKRDWPLLYHVQRTLFRTSPLQVDGPSQLVREFVALMQNADAEFQETKERVEKLERAFEVGVQEVEKLKRGR